MKKIHWVILLGFSILISCSNINNKERNSILFKDSLDTVQNALLRLTNLLDSLPEVPKEAEVASHYALEGEFLYVNNFNKRKINDSIIIPGLSKVLSHEFIELILFLKKNFITAATQSSNSKIWFFAYHKLWNEEYDYYRDIVVFNKSSDTLNLYLDNQILDQKKNILLVAPKDAKIINN